ncbi:MAG: HK97 family phage prohead protease [Pseudomonadota bacterium]
MQHQVFHGLETKYCAFGEDMALKGGTIEGYASVFGLADQGGDVVAPGAYQGALKAAQAPVRMLWQHDPTQPIGVWDEVCEDARGLYVRGRLLTEVQRGREALALLEAGAIDGLSIGYRTKKAEARAAGRTLLEIELWEVSVVTFPMLPQARVSTSEGDTLAQELTATFAAVREAMVQ